MMDLEIFGCSSTCSTFNHGDFCWIDWSPDVNWEHFACVDDYCDPLDSMMRYGDTAIDADYFSHLDTLPHQAWSSSVSPSSTNCPGTPAEEHTTADHDSSVRLVHLLMAVAEALNGPCKSPHLAQVILARLRELLAHGGASSMERLAAHFTNALYGLLDGTGADEPPQRPSEVFEALHLLQDMSPCVKFGHFTANQAILEAVVGEPRVHIVDYDIMEGLQWASLMQSMVSIENGIPPPHLRITAITRNRRSANETGRRLVAFAASVGLPFSFGQCQLECNDKFRPSAVKVVKGEAVVFNCILHPRSAPGTCSFLAGAAELKALVVTLVDHEREEIGFVGRFLEEMQRYSAMWDALEAGFPKQGRAREMVERAVFAPMITGAVKRAYMRVEEGETWREWLEAAEFRKARLSFFNLCQARLLLGLFNGGYCVEEDGPNKLTLCWKSCRLISASVWSAPSWVAAEGTYFSC